MYNILKYLPKDTLDLYVLLRPFLNNLLGFSIDLLLFTYSRYKLPKSLNCLHVFFVANYYD